MGNWKIAGNPAWAKQDIKQYWFEKEKPLEEKRANESSTRAKQQVSLENEDFQRAERASQVDQTNSQVMLGRKAAPKPVSDKPEKAKEEPEEAYRRVWSACKRLWKASMAPSTRCTCWSLLWRKKNFWFKPAVEGCSWGVGASFAEGWRRQVELQQQAGNLWTPTGKGRPPGRFGGCQERSGRDLQKLEQGCGPTQTLGQEPRLDLKHSCMVKAWKGMAGGNLQAPTGKLVKSFIACKSIISFACKSIISFACKSIISLAWKSIISFASTSICLKRHCPSGLRRHSHIFAKGKYRPHYRAWKNVDVIGYCFLFFLGD